MSLAFYATQRALKRLSGSSNEIVMTAIISPTIIRKPTDKQPARMIMQKQVANSQQNPFKFAIFTLEPEKHKKSQFEPKFLEHVRF